MITTTDNFIITTARQGQDPYADAYYNKQVRPCFYVEIFEGSIYDLIGIENVGGTPSMQIWKRLNVVEMTYNAQQGQSKSINFILPKDLFETDGYLNYNYDTGIYTANNGTKLSKYLVRSYEGYCENVYPYTEHVLKRFTGIIESIIPKEDGTIEVNAVDYSTIFLNALNYNYPDINSYRDLVYTDSNETLQEAILNTTQNYIMLPSNTVRVAGDKIRIGSEIMVILLLDTVTPGKALVQRLSGLSTHGVNDRIYIGDGFLVMPEDVYNDRLLSKYVPAYDNWLVKDAIRDICIKARFPLSKLVFDYVGETTLRLGASEKYPYMKTRPVMDSYLNTQTGLIRQTQNSLYNSDSQKGYMKLERKLYTGLDDDAFSEAKFKFEFGKNLWDCILSIVDGFGFRVYFDADGNLTIKGVRQYTQVRPIETTQETQLIENHVWYWKRWNINALSAPRRYTFSLATTACGIKFRFVANDTATDSMVVKLVKDNAGTFEPIGSNITLPALKPYQFYELEAYLATRSEDVLTAGTYGVELVSTVSNPAYFNGFMYLNNYDETSIYDADATINANIESLVNSIVDVRNQMTVIGQPKSQVPLISRVKDITSIWGGAYNIKTMTEDGTPFTNTSPFLDGRYDKYETLKTNTGSVIITASTGTTIKKLAIYLSAQNTPLGTTISIYQTGNLVTPIATHTIVANDLGEAGLVLWFSTPYNQIKVVSNIDLKISEIETYEDDPAYNFTGFKKETLIVKQNITDKATNDWLAYVQLEMHRRNIKSLNFPIFGNPMLETGDCILANAPQISANYDMRLWITGISTTISKINYTMSLSLVALPPAPSYTQPPTPEVASMNDVYDFAVNKYKVGTNELLYSADYKDPVYYQFALKEAITTTTQTTIKIDNSPAEWLDGLSPYDRLITGAIAVIGGEHLEIVSKALEHGDGTTLNVVVVRGKDYTTPATYALPNALFQNQVVKSFTPPDHFLTFGFALPEAKKVQFVVGVKRLNQVVAYVMEEKHIPAGVYKRENGIRWDGGINFAKVWPDTVDKIYLGPQESFNMMYNRMFNTLANSQWENPLNNYYSYNFDQDSYMSYAYGQGVAGTYAATSNGWRKTPYQWNAQIIVKPVLEGYNGSRALVPAITKTVDIQVVAPTYKLTWGDITPTTGTISQFTVITAGVKIYKDGVAQDLNDAVYFDVFVATENGGNVNKINAPNAGDDTGRRWVSSIGLITFFTWDMTDSQGKFVKAGKYKFCLQNVFDIYGEGVEVIKISSGVNIIDGSLRGKVNNNINVSSPFIKADYTLEGGWSINHALDSNFLRSKTSYDEWPGEVIAERETHNFATVVEKRNVYMSSKIESKGGHQLDDAYLSIKFVKQNVTKAWTWDAITRKSPFSLVTEQVKGREINALHEYFFSFYFKATKITGATSFTVFQLWNLYAIIGYKDTNGDLKYYTTPFSNMPDTVNAWDQAYVHFSPSNMPNGVTIESIGIESRACNGEVAGMLTAKWGTDGITLGIDSIQFGLGLTPPATYQDPSGGPRISDLFTVEA